MCRFLALIASQPIALGRPLITAAHSLQKQCVVDRRGERHADGWGVGYYLNGLPTVARFPTDAALDARFVELAERVRARLAIAHVRQASVGTTAEVNTHPFHEGCWLFAHNGTAQGFAGVLPQMQQEMGSLADRPHGDTDSEWIFFWLLSRMRRAGCDLLRPANDPASVTGALADSLNELARRCHAAAPSETTRLNFLLTDGVQLWATRHGHSLFQRSGAPPGESHRREEMAIVASEPLDEGDWREIPERSILTVDRDLRLQVHPL